MIDERAMAVIAARCVLVAVVLAFLARGGSRVDGCSVGTVVLIGLTFDVRSPFTLRNYLLLYSVGLFYVGSRVIYPGNRPLSADLLLYVAAFLCGYGIVKSSWPSSRRSGQPVTAFDGDHHSLATLETIIRVLGGVEVARLLQLVRPYGIRGFYSGQELVNRISSFGRTGSTTQAITNIVLTSLIAAVAALYCYSCLQAGQRIRYRLLFVVLIFVPAISLQRSVLVLHSLLLAGIYLCDKRRQPKPARHGSFRRWLPAGLMLVAAVVISVRIGDIRTKQIDQTILSHQAHLSSLQQVFRGEFTPIVFYRDAKENMGTLRYRYGKPIAGALVTRAVPRAVWPNKPMTSQEIYMRAIRPAQLAQGFSLAPSLFGVLYMNFGMLGTAVCVGLLGCLAAYFDQALAGGLLSRVPEFLIVLTWFYSVMRDDLATSLFSVLLTLVIYRFLHRYFTATVGTG